MHVGKNTSFCTINMSMWRHWGQIMDASLHRRISVASCWATTRLAVLDSLEQYEDSYAITQEFREWITCLGDHPEHLDSAVLKFPHHLERPVSKEPTDTDGVLEI